MNKSEIARQLGKAFKLGYAFSRGQSYRKGIAQDEAKWITVHPNGKGMTRTGDKAKGQPVLIDGDTGEVLGGMGGKFTGKHISAVPKRGKEEQHGAQAKIDRAHSRNKNNDAQKLNEGRSQSAARIRNFIGDQHYEKAKQFIEKTDEKTQGTWFAYENEIKVDSTTYKKTAHFNPKTGGISFDLQQDSNGSKYTKPYETMFHEFGHNIDRLAAKRHGLGLYISSGYKDGAFPNTLKEEVAQIVKEDLKQLKESHKSAKDLRKWLEDHKEYVETWDYNYLYERPLSIKPSTRMVYRAISNRLKNLPPDEQSAISDIFEGASGAKIRSNFGHYASYWKYPGTLATEAFANLFQCALTNKPAYDRIKERLPKSVAIFEEMLDLLSGENNGSRSKR